MDSPLALEVQKENLPEQDVVQLQGAFAPFFEQAENLKAEALSIVVTSIDQVDDIKKAREMRLRLQKIRTKTEESRKLLKDESLRRGRAIDGMANLIKFVVVPLEKHLQEQEDFVELARQRKVEELKQKRIAEMWEYQVDVKNYAGLGEMPDDVYANLLSGAKHTYELAVQAAKKAEEDRKRKEQEAIAKQERIRLENEKLKQQAKEEQEKREEEQKKREAAEAELRFKREAEEKAEKARKAEEARKAREAKKLAAAPDKKKLQLFADLLDALDLPVVESEEAQRIVEGTDSLIGKVSHFIRMHSEDL